MKKFSYIQCLFVILYLYSINLFSQQNIIPGIPCSPNIKATTGAPTAITLKIILVEFSDVKHRTTPSAYTYANYDSMFFSSNHYVSPNMYSPDGEQLFGSVADYFRIMSNNNLTITGSVVNPDNNQDGLPDWVGLNNTKLYYDDTPVVFYRDARIKAFQMGIDTTTSATTKLVLIYAGSIWRKIYLVPMAFAQINLYQIGERFTTGEPYFGERSEATFTHIGIHCHELAHVLGIPDRHLEDNYSNSDLGEGDTGYWDLMGAGNYNGPYAKGECPAPINPWDRMQKGWITLTNCNSNGEVTMDYNLISPQVYKVTSSSNSSDEFLFEMRSFNSTMQLGNFTCSDYNTYLPHGTQTKGVLAFRRYNRPIKVPTEVALSMIHANGSKWIWDSGGPGTVGDIFPGTSSKYCLAPNTDTRIPGDKDVANQYQFWAPNTKPSSNVGMFITDLNNNKVYLYNTNPPSTDIWPSYVNIVGNVTVAQGVTLAISSGTTVNFLPGTNLTINGSLNASGNSSSGITFSRSGSSGTWGGIQFNSNSSGSLSYCNISNADYGIKLYNSSPTISHCTISNGNYGIFSQYSNPVLSHNTITGQSNYGISCYDSDPELASSGQGHNVIRQNNAGIAAGYGSTINLSNGNNCVHNNTGYEIFASNISTVNAVNTWWNVMNAPYFTTNDFLIQSSSTVNADANPNTLDHDPNSCPLPKISVQEEKIIASEKFILDNELSELFKLEQERKYDAAISQYVKKYNAEKNIEVKRYIIIRLAKCYRAAGKKDFTDFLNKEIKQKLDKSDDLYATTLEAENILAISNQDFKKATENFITLTTTFAKNEEIYKHALFNLGYLYYTQLGDKENGKKYLDELKTKYPEGELAIHSRLLLGEGNTIPSYGVKKEITEKTTIPNEYLLYDNYPNPFNPTTNISFSIPQRSNVKLVVYDVLGKEVSILANGIHEAGKYDVTFNASNLPSGVYFYNLTTSQGTISKKMLLVK